MDIAEEIYRLQRTMEKELTELKKLLVPISLYYSEKLKEEKNGSLIKTNS